MASSGRNHKLISLLMTLIASGFLLVHGAEWDDFTGGCLQPAELAANEVLVFTSPAKVLKAIGRYKQDRLAGTCGEEFREAFERLEWVLDKTHVLKDICGSEAYERIRSFHEEFIHFYVPELTREQLRLLNGPDQDPSARQQFRWPWQPKQLVEEKSVASAAEADASARPELKPIPVALRQFFINFAKQANAHCKQQLLERLDALQTDVRFVDPDDFKVIDRYKSESLKLSFLYELTQADMSSYGHERQSDFDRLEMVDFERPAPRFGQSLNANRRTITLKSGSREISISNKAGEKAQGANEEDNTDDDDDDDDDGKKLFLQVPFDDNLKRIKEACRKRFMPIYMELFAPVIKLNNLGYIDRVNSANDNIKLDESAEINRWFDVIQTCEVLKDIEIMHDSSADNAVLDMVFSRSHLPELTRRRQSQNGLKAGSNGRQSIKILSRREAAELRAHSLKQQVRPLYDPRLSPIPHQACKYTERMWLTEAKVCRQQAGEFERDVKRMISRKTSLVRNFKRDLTFKLKLAFNSGKRQVLERDESSKLGRLVAFVERHQNLIRGFGLIMSVIVISMSVFG